jgi:hypothetical protein
MSFLSIRTISDFSSIGDDSDDESTNHRAEVSRKLSLEQLEAFSKPWNADVNEVNRSECRRKSTSSVRPECVPALQLKKNKADRDGANQWTSGFGNKDMLKSLHDDIEHYTLLLKTGTNKVTDNLQRMMLFPSRGDQGETVPQQNSDLLLQALARKFLPAFGVFHAQSLRFSGSHHSSAQSQAI